MVDSTPIYDAVATMDTVTLIRSAIRGLLRAAGPRLEAELRGLLAHDDDYAGAGKPVCDWDDRVAREALVDALARDAMALLGALDGQAVGLAAAEAAALLATVVGQDLDTGEDGVFRIAAGSPRTGSSPPSTPKPGTGTRPPHAGSTGTKATSPPTRTPRSSPTPTSPPATPPTARPPRASSPTPCHPTATTTRATTAATRSTRANASTRTASTRTVTGPRSTGTLPTAPVSCWPGWKPLAWTR